MGILVHDNSLQFHKVGSYPVNFEAANQDTSGAQYNYFGFISSFGSWIIMRFDIQGSNITYKYVGGQTRTDYDVLWDGTGSYIGSESFDTFDQLGANL